MIRRALIIYCDDTKSGKLKGPSKDNTNLRNHLTSYIGGEWYDFEIKSLNNPTSQMINVHIESFFENADYSFVVFSGHGFLNADEDYIQYLEVADKDISIAKLLTKAKRQTILIDACRGIYSPQQEDLIKASRSYGESFIGSLHSTRKLFETKVLEAEEGLSILYAANVNQSAVDSNIGGAYTYSLLKSCEQWGESNRSNNALTIKEAHELGSIYMKSKFLTNQTPVMQPEKRMKYFPLSVKLTPIYG
jgi:Caspase domain